MNDKIKIFIKQFIPKAYQQKVKRAVLRSVFQGRKFYCNVCNSSIRLWKPLGYDLPVLAEKQIVGAGFRYALCPVCGSSDRIRLLLHFLKSKTNLFQKDIKLLHFAPEPSLKYIFENQTNIDYLTADLNPEEVMMKIDITNIPFPENSFDAIMCNHVLEHISDDHKAMTELFRVLKSGGWAILQVPISKVNENTFEDDTVITPEDKEKIFGQKDHVRIYGSDYTDRLKKVGFKIDIYHWQNEDKLENPLNKMKLNPDEVVFFCRK